MKTRLLKKVRRRYSIRLQQVYCKETNTFSSEYVVYDKKREVKKYHTLYGAIDALMFLIHWEYLNIVRSDEAVSTKVWWK